MECFMLLVCLHFNNYQILLSHTGKCVCAAYFFVFERTMNMQIHKNLFKWVKIRVLP
jgi:hypothetical protein